MWGFSCVCMCSQRTKLDKLFLLFDWNCEAVYCPRGRREEVGEEGRGMSTAIAINPSPASDPTIVEPLIYYKYSPYSPPPPPDLLLLTIGIGPTCSENSLRTIKSFSNFGFFEPSFSAPGKGILASQDVLQPKRKLLQGWDSATSTSPHSRRYCNVYGNEGHVGNIYRSLVPRFALSRLRTKLHFTTRMAGKSRDKMDLDLYADLENPFFPVTKPDSEATSNEVLYTGLAAPVSWVS